jgi:cytochrome b pre-mRNA-processing protein 3
MKPRSFGALNPLKAWRRKDAGATKLYGSIVAQARLPVFYQRFGVPDSLQGRFLLLSLHLFAVLHRLKAEGSAALVLAQDLTDRFSADMETVLREIGIGDLAIPKKVRRLAASSVGLLQSYEEAMAKGQEGLAAVIGELFESGPSEGASAALAHYLTRMVRQLEAQPFAALKAAEVRFPEVGPGKERGDPHDE